MNKNVFEYDVAFSFAGEQREYVEQVFNCLTQKGIKVYYDKNQDLWGKDLFIEFSEAYSKKSQYLVVFISKEYAEKDWTKHEIANAFERALQEKSEYILPVRFDNTQIPGLRSTIHFEDGSIAPEQLCEKIINKINGSSGSNMDNNDEIEVPRIKRKITDFEKDKFLQESFSILKDYFKKGLIKTEQNHSNVKTQFEEVTTNKFVAKIYVDGDIKLVCKIWIGTGFSSNYSIRYLEGNSRLNYDDENSYNGSAHVEENGREIYLKILDMGFGILDKNINLEEASGKDLSIYFWGKFIQNVSY